MIMSSFGAHIDGALNGMFTLDRRPHAVLIDGGSESERQALARLVASAFVCESNSKPCGNCEGCRKLNENIHPDVITVTRPDDKKFFKKDDVKKVVSDAFSTPNEAETKVFILSEMQFMNEESQNVLLKILEEPPVYTAFVLTAQSAASVIGTVLSRVVRLRLGNEGESEFPEKAVEAAKAIAKAVGSPYEYEKLAATSVLDANKQLTAQTLSALVNIFRDAYAQKCGGKAISTEFASESLTLCENLSLSRLLELYETVCSFLKALDNNPNNALLVATLTSKL